MTLPPRRSNNRFFEEAEKLEKEEAKAAAAEARRKKAEAARARAQSIPPGPSPEQPKVYTPAQGDIANNSEPSDVANNSGIPSHVWSLLQEAGEVAAERLLTLLSGKKFDSYKPADQRALIDLALTRAYGLPVRRAVQLNLNTDDQDAVAASLNMLSRKITLPERRGPMKDVSNDD